MNDFLNRIADYFTSDPLRLLTLLGGSGGLLYWIDRYRNRTRLRVHWVTDALKSPDSGENAVISFEIENCGPMPTSLKPAIRITAYTLTGRSVTFHCYVTAEDRNLSPYTPRRFIATAADQQADNFPFLWFRKYSFQPTRGHIRTVRIRSIEGRHLSAIRYFFECSYFRLFKRFLAVHDSPDKTDIMRT